MSNQFCEWCKTEFVRKVNRGGNRDSNRFCSRECAFAWREHKKSGKTCKVYFLKCECCESLFTAKRNYSKYCSSTCRKVVEEQKRLRKEKANKKSVRQCKICGDYFAPEYGNKRRSFCSSECKDKAEKQWLKATRKKRKAKIKSVAVHNITVEKLVKRDRHVCGICGQKVDGRRKSPHPKSATMDHVLPLSRGGWHEWSNVQLAHRKCNEDKSNKMPQNMRKTLIQYEREGCE